MRRALLIVAILFAPVLSGCTVADFVYGVFGSAYTEGGPSSLDRQSDFESRVEASQAAAKYGTES